MFNITKILQLSPLLPRLGFAAVFGYFGILAVLNPADEGAAWIQEPFYGIIARILPITVFMTIFGIMQITLSILLISGKYPSYAFGIAALMLAGIIFQLSIAVGFGNDIVMRDVALCLTAIGLGLQNLKPRAA